MKLIVGLGNPGEKYAHTRHNLGFLTIDQVFKDLTKVNTAWEDSSKFKSHIANLMVKNAEGVEEKVILVKPQTFMNNSGEAVQPLVEFYKVPIEDVWIVYDELDLPLGHLKIRNGGAAAGHRGVESIMEVLGTEKFWRFRLGIGKSRDKEQPVSNQKIRDAKEYVLDVFQDGEVGKAKDLIKRGSQAIQTALEKGMETASNRFNS